MDLARESFETEDLKDQISKCETLGIGILSVNVNEKDSVVKELLEARRNIRKTFKDKNQF